MRVILVQSLANMDWQVQMAAILTGSLVQESLLQPAIGYRPLMGHTFAFTNEFRSAHRGVVRIVKVASQRAMNALSVLKLGQLVKRKQAKFPNTTVLHVSASDSELRDASRLVGIAKLFPEFIRSTARLR